MCLSIHFQQFFEVYEHFYVIVYLHYYDYRSFYLSLFWSYKFNVSFQFYANFINCFIKYKLLHLGHWLSVQLFFFKLILKINMLR